MVRKKAINACWKTRPPVTTCRPSFAVLTVLLSERRPPPIWTMKDLMLISVFDNDEGQLIYIMSKQTNIFPIHVPLIPKIFFSVRNSCVNLPNTM